MKILHVIRGLANSSGTTHIVGPLAEAQARLEHDVAIFFVEKPGEQAVVPDVQLVESRRFPMTVSSRHYGWSRSFQRELRRRIGEFDVVHIHAIWNFPTWCAMREANRVRVPYMVAPQGSLEDWALGRSRHLKGLYARVFEKPWFDRAACMQALTETEADQCRRFGIRAGAAILPNGVDLHKMDCVPTVADIRAELNLPADEMLLVFLGRIFPKKGLDLLAAAFGKLVQRPPRGLANVTLLIAGHDAGTGYQSDVAGMLNRSGGAAKTKFLGELRGRRKFHVLRAANVFVLSSYSEGLPVAAVEAMGIHLPVIVTPGCNLPEVAEAEAGWIAAPTPEALYETMCEALRDPGEMARRGRNARRLVEERFTWPIIARRSIELYRQILQSPKVDANEALASKSREGFF